MEHSFKTQKKALAAKLPDIEEALESIQFLKTRNEQNTIKTRFVLSENIIAKAEVAPTTSVFLWLGVRTFLLVNGEPMLFVCIIYVNQANTLLEYPLDEAVEMLQKNKSNAEVTINELVRQ